MADNFDGDLKDGSSENPYRAGFNRSDEYTPAQSNEQPTSVKVFGILNLVFGCLGVITIIMQVAMFALFTFSEQPEGTPNPMTIAMGESIFQQAFMAISMILGAVFTFVLIFAGIGLLQSRQAGRTLSIAYGWYAIVSGIAGAVVNYFFVMQPLFANQGPGGANLGPGLIVAMTLGGVCIGLIYPVLLLIFMGRANVRASLH